jgi:hypothetical protein
MRFTVKCLTENEKVMVYEGRAARYQNKGVKYLCVLKRVIETAVTALWNRQITTAHSQFDVFECVGYKC